MAFASAARRPVAARPRPVLAIAVVGGGEVVIAACRLVAREAARSAAFAVRVA